MADAAAPRDGCGRITLRLFDSREPVIAAVNGPAGGMGATMLLAADIRMASDSARFGFVFTRRGIAPEGASTWFLPRVVGISQAAEWLYTGRVFDAAEALAAGLVRSVHPAEDLLAGAKLAAEIAEAAPVSVALTRQMLWRMLGVDHPMAAHRADSRAVYATGAGADAREGVRHFWRSAPLTSRDESQRTCPISFPIGNPPSTSSADDMKSRVRSLAL